MSERRYNYLKQYLKKELPANSNYFEPIMAQEITDAELALGIKFPTQLIEFYSEIGYGFLIQPVDAPADYVFYGTNRLNAPSQIVEMLKNGSESGMISEDVLEDLEPGDLPFFEISDSSSFMIMKTQSDNPNAVWFMGVEKIEDSLEDFIHNLYYKGPRYYTEGW